MKEKVANDNAEPTKLADHRTVKPHPSRNQTGDEISFPNKCLTFFQIEVGNICRSFFIITGKAFEVICHLTGLLSGLSTTRPKQQAASSQTGHKRLFPLQSTRQQAVLDLPPGLPFCNPTFCMLLIQCPISPKGIEIWCHQSFICKTTTVKIKSLPSAILRKEFAQNKP